MKNTNVICNRCNTEFLKPLKEVTRQRKNGRNYFYCSRKCASIGNKNNLKGNISNLIPENRLDEFSNFREILRRCNQRDKNCNIDLLYLKELWKQQSGKCAYTNVDLLLPTYNTKYNFNYMASLDRINSDNGYIKGNVQYVSVTLNYLKHKFSNNHVFEFFNIIQSLGQNLESTDIV